MKKIFIYLLLAVFCIGNAFAVPFKPNSDEIILGRGNNTIDKTMTFDVGDGASNPRLLIDDILKVFDFNKDLSVTGNIGAIDGNFSGVLDINGDSVTIGDGTNTDKTQTFDVGAGVNNPYIGWSSSDNALVFNNGTSEKKIGAGTGGGGGENFNNAFTTDDNANAEDGTQGWVNSGGTFNVTSTDPLEGEQSFIYTPGTQNHYVQGPLLNVDRDIFKGRACQARVEYIGGDENLEFRILDASGATFKSLPLPAHNISAAEDIFFLCPSASDISGNANLGQLRVQIFNAGLSASPLIKFDKLYLGTLIGLSEAVLPDVFAARIECNAGGCTVLNQTNDFLNGNPVRDSIGTYTVNFTPGIFSELPSIVALNYDNSAYSISASGQTLNSVQIAIRQMSTESATGDFTFHLVAVKQGADAKQAVQVYKSVPRISENLNDLNARLDTSCNISDQNVIGWIDSCSKLGTGQWSINYAGLNLSSAPVISAFGESETSPNGFQCNVDNITTTSTTINCVNVATGAREDRNIKIKLQKMNGDFKLPTVQPILVNQVSTSEKNGLKVETCRIINSGGTPTAGDGCATWVSSFTDNGVGDYNVNFIPGVFSNFVNCVGVAQGASDRLVNTGTTNPTTVNVIVEETNPFQFVDANVSLVCVGGR